MSDYYHSIIHKQRVSELYAQAAEARLAKEALRASRPARRGVLARIRAMFAAPAEPGPEVDDEQNRQEKVPVGSNA